MQAYLYVLCYNFCIRPAKNLRRGAPEDTYTVMSSKRSNLRLIGAFGVLATLVLAVSCKGFFVKPTLSSLAVGPASPTIETGNTHNTVQMTVFGTNSDGSTSSNPSVAWSIDQTSVATISATGLVTSVGIGTANVTATSNENPTITGTQGVTVTVGCVSAITLDTTSGSVSASSGSTVSITANATTCNGSHDVTSVATWRSSNTNLATVTAGVVSALAGITSGGTVQITASIGSITSNVATINVTP